LITILASAAFIYVFWEWPTRGLGPEQPIPFSHNVHSGVKQIQCQYCHPYVAYSNFPGIPPVEKCLHCHNYIIKKHPWIQKEHKYFNTQTSTPWVKVNYIPEHVLFNHQRQSSLPGMPRTGSKPATAAFQGLADGDVPGMPQQEKSQCRLLVVVSQLAKEVISYPLFVI